MKKKVKVNTFAEALEKCPWATSASKARGNSYICSNE